MGLLGKEVTCVTETTRVGEPARQGTGPTTSQGACYGQGFSNVLTSGPSTHLKLVMQVRCTHRYLLCSQLKPIKIINNYLLTHLKVTIINLLYVNINTIFYEKNFQHKFSEKNDILLHFFQYLYSLT